MGDHGRGGRRRAYRKFGIGSVAQFWMVRFSWFARGQLPGW
jgi:hypothetical protein